VVHCSTPRFAGFLRTHPESLDSYAKAMRVEDPVTGLLLLALAGLALGGRPSGAAFRVEALAGRLSAPRQAGSGSRSRSRQAPRTSTNANAANESMTSASRIQRVAGLIKVGRSKLILRSSSPTPSSPK
jgi:hypothetical protein